MSHAPNTLNQTLENLLNNVLEKTDIDSPRSRAISIEAYQRYIEFLGDALDTPVTFDTGVTIRVRGKTIRFSNEQAMADFLMELK